MDKKYWLAVGFALVLLLGSLVLLNPRIGFTYYEPTYLPDGVTIKSKRIELTIGTYSVSQNFRTEDWVYSIREYEASGTIGSADQNYDPASPKPTCSIKNSPGGQTYRVCHWIDYERIDVQEIKFIKNGTFIRALIPSSLNNKIISQDIEKFVDSFQKASTRGFKVLRSNGA